MNSADTAEMKIAGFVDIADTYVELRPIRIPKEYIASADVNLLSAKQPHRFTSRTLWGGLCLGFMARIGSRSSLSASNYAKDRLQST